jgi:RNA polymerase sigma-70 factor (ECF subfamily)
MDTAALADDSVIRRCIAGEDAAWRDLHRALYPAAVSFLRQMGVQPAELDDVCQDVFVQVYRYLGRFQARSQLTTWVYKICMSQAARLRRKQKVARALGAVFGAREAEAVQATIDVPEEELARRTSAAVAQLPSGQREVFVLYELQGLSGEQIAEIMECPVATVWSRLHYARREFKRLVDEGNVADVERERQPKRRAHVGG